MWRLIPERPRRKRSAAQVENLMEGWEKMKELAERWRDQSHDRVSEKSSGRFGERCPVAGRRPRPPPADRRPERRRLFLPTSSPPEQRRSGRLAHSLLPWSSPSMTSQEMKYVLVGMCVRA